MPPPRPAHIISLQGKRDRIKIKNKERRLGVQRNGKWTYVVQFHQTGQAAAHCLDIQNGDVYDPGVMVVAALATLRIKRSHICCNIQTHMLPFYTAIGLE
jgi:hypothetical protein